MARDSRIAALAAVGPGVGWLGFAAGVAAIVGFSLHGLVTHATADPMPALVLLAVAGLGTVLALLAEAFDR